MKLRRLLVWTFIFCFATVQVSASTITRIKDIVTFEGVRDNVLIGYGLVVGLNASGDNAGDSPFTKVSMKSMMERLGIQIDANSLKTKSIAAVLVTGKLPAFARNGSHFDVDISTIGSATSLLGGTLLATPLQGADGEVYAVAQGPLVVSGYNVKGDQENVTKGVPTRAKIMNGATVEKEIHYKINNINHIHLHLNNPDFTTARRVADAINRRFVLPIAKPLDWATIKVDLPKPYLGKVVDFMTVMEQVVVETDQRAKVVINEESGVIVMGEKVRIDRVAIAQANLVIEIQESKQVFQPGAFTNVQQATEVAQTSVKIDEDSDARMRILNTGTSLSDVVNGLNSLGVGPRELMSILQSIKAAGALQADLEVI